MNGPEIKTLRTGMKLSQTDFAEKIGVTFLTIHRWESGKSRPHKSFVKTMRRIQAKVGA